MTAPIDLSADHLDARADDFYAALIAAHDGLDERQSAALNARLILLLANLVGDTDIIIAAIEAAKIVRS